MSKQIYRGWILPTLLLTILAGVIGCGDGRGKRVPVSGLVTIDGKPLQHGSVTFIPVAGEGVRAGGASIDSEGRFEVSSFTPNDGLMAGTYDVTILATEHINERSQRWHAPMVYSEMINSGFRVEISGSTEAMNLELTWEKDKEHSAPFVERF